MSHVTDVMEEAVMLHSYSPTVTEGSVPNPDPVSVRVVGPDPLDGEIDMSGVKAVE